MPRQTAAAPSPRRPGAASCASLPPRLAAPRRPPRRPRSPPALPAAPRRASPRLAAAPRRPRSPRSPPRLAAPRRPPRRPRSPPRRASPRLAARASLVEKPHSRRDTMCGVVSRQESGFDRRIVVSRQDCGFSRRRGGGWLRRAVRNRLRNSPASAQCTPPPQSADAGESSTDRPFDAGGGARAGIMNGCR